MVTAVEMVRFGLFRWDPVNRLLLRDEIEVPLPPRVVALLECLLEQPGRVISRQELIDRVWRDAFVTDTSLAEAVSFLRQALGDDPQEPRYVQTIHRRGYRFVAPVETGPVRADGDVTTEVAAPAPNEGAAEVGPSIGALVPWSLVVLLGATLVVTLWKLTHPVAGIEPRVTRFELALPSGLWLRTDPNGLAVSPDSRAFAFVGCRAESCALYVRHLHEPSPRSLADTSEAAAPFFSPDGQFIGFFAEGKLKKAPLAGGAATVLCDAPDALGAAWLDDGRIVFAGHRSGGLELVGQHGGTPSPLTTVDARTGELGHRRPHWLPGTNLVIFTAVTAPSDPEANRAMAFSLTDRRVHLVSSRAKDARLISPDVMMFGRGMELQAVRFDAARGLLSSSPVPVAGNVRLANDGLPLLATSATGTLLLVQGGSPPQAEVVSGAERQRLPPALEAFREPALDPRGARLAGVIADGLRADLWLGDATRGTATRVTDEHRVASPVWSADGKRIIYSAAVDGVFNLWIADPDAPSSQRLLKSGAHQFASAVAPSGLVVFTQIDPQTRGDIWMTDTDGRTTALSRTRFDERDGTISPDGRWLAYVSDESGRWQVYVKAVTGPDRFVVSPAGAARPWWLADGRLVYVAPDGDLNSMTIGPGGPVATAPARTFPGSAVLAVARSGVMLLSRHPAPAANAMVTLEAWQEIWRALPPAVTTLPR